MRILLFSLSTLTVVVLAIWAYSENHKTRMANDRLERLAVEIGKEREKLNHLKAEWAYLSRPERLAALVERYFDELQLVPLTSDNLIPLREVPLMLDVAKATSASKSEEDLPDDSEANPL